MSANTAKKPKGTEAKESHASAASATPIPEISATPGFLLNIQRALNNTDGVTLYKPDEKVEKGEKPLRVLTNPAVRGLYSLMVELRSRARSVIPKEMPRRQSAQMAIHEELEAFSQQIETVGNLFWGAIVDSLGDDVPSSLGIREGWQIVTNVSADKNPGARANSIMREMVGGLVERLREHGFGVLGEFHGDGRPHTGRLFSGLGGRGRG